MDNEGTAYCFLGQKIRAERKRLRMTQAELSCGIVTRNMLSRIENGDALPSLTTLALLAQRLDVSVSYLLDVADDGSEEKTRRLLMMAQDEFLAENYDSCIGYASCLPDGDERRDRLVAMSNFHLGVRLMYDGSLRRAQTHIAAALKHDSFLLPSMVVEGREYRALLDAFAFEPKQGKEEEAFLSVLKFSTSPTDLSLLASVISVLRHAGASVADAMLSSLVFSEKGYVHLLAALIAREEGKHKEAKTQLFEAMGYRLFSPIKAYCYTLLEEICASLSDFENAYAYMNLRRELMQVLLEK